MTKAHQKLDPRLTPARGDLAAASLQGRVNADRFVESTPKEIGTAIAPIHKKPYPDAPRETELLFGETVQLYEEKDGWAWVQHQGDGYVGYTPAEALISPGDPKTHRITALRTYVFSQADIKSRPLHLISMNSMINTASENGRFTKITFGGYVITDHIAPFNDKADDFVAIAEQFLKAPYLWGGRTSLGLDCSALVQNALARIGIKAPRDTDMQEATLGTTIATTLDTELQRGDLIFWKGHVGIMIDKDHMVHANGTWMQVTIDNVRNFAARVLSDSGPITSVKRLT